MAIDKTAVASFIAYDERANLQNELELTVTNEKLELVAQTLAVNAPAIVFYDPTTLNFQAVHVDFLDPNWKFVEIITGIS